MVNVAEMSDLEIVNRLKYSLHYGGKPDLELVIEAEKRNLAWVEEGENGE